jgi:hypothetical protein
MHTALWLNRTRHVVRRAPNALQQSPVQAITRSTRTLSSLLSNSRQRQPFAIGDFHQGCKLLLNTRGISWSFRQQPESPQPQGFSGEQEDATKSAILDKLMKGRQPADLMLRCASPVSSPHEKATTDHLSGTVIDAEGPTTPPSEKVIFD